MQGEKEGFRRSAYLHDDRYDQGQDGPDQEGAIKGIRVSVANEVYAEVYETSVGRTRTSHLRVHFLAFLTATLARIPLNELLRPVSLRRRTGKRSQ